VALEMEIQKAIETGVPCFGKLNILYNNAGVLWRDSDFEVSRTDEATWDKVMAINFKGTAPVYKYGIPELKIFNLQSSIFKTKPPKGGSHGRRSGHTHFRIKEGSSPSADGAAFECR
jgi:NAD(P)-dependent dehydrogenase (short-subunit alcohol dehydrogenase family)